MKQKIFNFRPETPEQVYRMKKLAFIADIVLIVVIGSLGAYVFSNIEHFKIIGQDVCRLCMEKTGANCFALNPLN